MQLRTNEWSSTKNISCCAAVCCFWAADTWYQVFCFKCRMVWSSLRSTIYPQKIFSSVSERCMVGGLSRHWVSKFYWLYNTMLTCTDTPNLFDFDGWRLLKKKWKIKNLFSGRKSFVGCWDGSLPVLKILHTYV